MAIGLFNLVFSKPSVLPLPAVTVKQIPLGRHDSQTGSIIAADRFLSLTTAKQSGGMKLLCRNNALLLQHLADRIVEAPIHIWLNLVLGVHDIMIYGYWIGPDLEDGWGFVEASVNQIYTV